MAAYMAHGQDEREWGLTLLVRGLAISTRALAQTVASFGHEYVASVEALDSVRDRALLPERVAALIASFFGMLALLLAGIGVYGLMSYEVVEQAKELGIRIALGATPRNILMSVIWRGALLTAVGILVGLVGAWASAGLVRSLLFGVTERDVATWAGATLLLLTAAAVGCVIPGARAARIEPMDAVRRE